MRKNYKNIHKYSICVKIIITGIFSVLVSQGFILYSYAQIECYNFENPNDIKSFDFADWNQTSPGYRSPYSIKSGDIDPGKTSSIILKEIVGPANISFYWKAEESVKWDGSVRTNIGKFSFMVNDIEIDLEGNAENWNKKEIFLCEGDHHLEWRFYKYPVGGRIPVSAGAGWIDYVCISGIEARISKPTTEGPTTEGPTTEGPTTEGPTTEGPTTASELLVIPISPNDGELFLVKSVYNTKPLNFEFMLFDASTNNQKANCCLYLSNDSENIKWNECAVVAANIKHGIPYYFSKECDYSWNIKCLDVNGTVYMSRNQTIQVKKNYFNTTTYVDNYNDLYNYTYNSINEAINHVEPNGVVMIRDGIYEENIIINKSILITSNNRNTVIRPKNINDFVIKITENNVTIKNMSIIGGAYGIYLESCSDCIVRDVTVSGFEKLGIYLDKCESSVIDNSSINSIKLDVISGIYLVDSNNCRLINNIIDNNIMTEYGIFIYHSNNNNVSNNYIRNTDDGIQLNGGSWGNIIEGDNKYISIAGCHIYTRDCGENDIPIECEGKKDCKKCP